MPEATNGVTPPEPITPVEEPQISLAEHKATFWPKDADAESMETAPPVIEPVLQPAPTPPKKTKHHTRSQIAAPSDIEAINSYTGKLREAEKAIHIEQKPGESQRVYELRRRVEIAEMARNRATPPPTVAAPPVPAPTVVSPAAPTSTFTEPEPTQAQFVDRADPYGAFQRALAAWDRRKETFDAEQASAKTRAESAQKAAQDQHQQWVAARNAEHGHRLDTFMAAHPDAKRLFDAEAAKPEAEQMPLTPVLYAAMHLHEHGPAFMMTLLNDRNFADELFLLTDGKPLGNPVTNPLVATVQRRLLARGQTVSTGSAASPPRLITAPRPPNPVRTVPQSQTETNVDGSAEMSLRDHRKLFPANGRR